MNRAFEQMKLEADQWKLDVGDVAGESLFWPTTPTRIYPIIRADEAAAADQNTVITRRPSSILSLQQTSNRPPSGLQSPSSGISIQQTNHQGLNPASLCQLTLEAFLIQLKNLCQDRNYGENKRGLKHFLKFCLPTPLRQSLLELCLKDQNRIHTLVDVSQNHNIFLNSNSTAKSIYQG